MSINDELSTLSVNKANIYNAIVSKGITPEKNGFDYFASAINNIAVGNNVIDVTQISQIQLENKPKGTCYVYKPDGVTISRIIVYLMDSTYQGYEGKAEWYIFSFDSVEHSFKMLGYVIEGQTARRIGNTWMNFYEFNDTLDFSRFSNDNEYPHETSITFTSGNLTNCNGYALLLDSNNNPSIVYYNVDSSLGMRYPITVFSNNLWDDNAYKTITFTGDSTVDSYHLLWMLCNGSFNDMALYYENN